MEKFIKFLEDNNAWENFERNFIEQGRSNRGDRAGVAGRYPPKGGINYSRIGLK